MTEFFLVVELVLGGSVTNKATLSSLYIYTLLVLYVMRGKCGVEPHPPPFTL